MTNINNRFVRTIATELAKVGIDSYYVGGCVRDAALGLASDDIDVCLVGSNFEDVHNILNKFGQAKLVGESFPVWKIKDSSGQEYDFALARTEQKSGASRKDFALNFGPSVTIKDDLLRRDLTINAIAQNVLTGEIVDPFNGVGHLENRIAHPVSAAFAEDTLRVLRAARFIARFGLTPTNEFIEMCKGLVPTDISNERVGKELTKLLSQTNTPSMFFRFLKEVDWLQYHFQELDTLVGLPQEKQWHPEGDVFEHTMHCIDAAKTPFMRVTMLCHDLGKATTTKMIGGKWKAPGHAKAGVKPTVAMLKRIVFGDTKLQDKIAMLVETHMFHVNKEFSRKAVGRMINRLASVGLSFDDLVEVCRCDVSGRPPLEGFTPYIGQDLAEDFKVQKGQEIKPIVNGSMLIQMGCKPGPELGRIKTRLLEEQMAGNLNKNNWREFL